MTNRVQIESNAPRTNGRYSHAIISHGLVFCARLAQPALRSGVDHLLSTLGVTRIVVRVHSVRRRIIDIGDVRVPSWDRMDKQPPEGAELATQIGIHKSGVELLAFPVKNRGTGTLE
jgi:hypothetical protein